METAGVEPVTSWMSTKHSNHLSYASMRFSDAPVVYHISASIAIVILKFLRKMFYARQTRRKYKRRPPLTRQAHSGKINKKAKKETDI